MSISLKASADGLSAEIILNGNTVVKIDANGIVQGSVPAGAVQAFAQAAAPSGWLECNGQAVNRTGTGAALFAAIGTIYGTGDGVSTFNVPDYRGYFLRALGTNADGTASGARGVKTVDDIKSHQHTYGTSSSTSGAANASMYGNITSPYGGGTTNSTGGAETRPKNMAVLTCIKL